MKEFAIDNLAGLVLFLVNLFYARLNTVYHPDFLCKKYIVIKNDKLAKILVSRTVLFSQKDIRQNEYRERMCLCGLFLYIIAIISGIFWAICVLSNDNFQENALSIIAVCVVTSGAFDTINKSPYSIKKSKHKKLRCFIYILFAIIILFFSTTCLITSFQL